MIVQVKVVLCLIDASCTFPLGIFGQRQRGALVQCYLVLAFVSEPLYTYAIHGDNRTYINRLINKSEPMGIHVGSSA